MHHQMYMLELLSPAPARLAQDLSMGERGRRDMPPTANQATMLERRGNTHTHTLALCLSLSLSVLVLQLQVDFVDDLVSCV